MRQDGAPLLWITDFAARVGAVGIAFCAELFATDAGGFANLFTYFVATGTEFIPVIAGDFAHAVTDLIAVLAELVARLMELVAQFGGLFANLGADLVPLRAQVFAQRGTFGAELVTVSAVDKTMWMGG